MTSVNVLKQVRKRATVPAKEKLVKARAIKYNFKRNNPYSFFFGKSAEEIDESINYIYNLKEYPGHDQLVKILAYVKNTVPMSLLPMFFTTAHNNDAYTAFKRISETKEAREMHNIIVNRSPNDIKINTSIPNLPKKIAQPTVPQSERKIQLLKYTKQDLNKKSVADLHQIAIQEGITVAQTASKSQLIQKILAGVRPEIIHRQESAEEQREHTRFTTDLIPKCQSNYRSAPWITRMVQQGKLKLPGKLNGFALRAPSEYITTYEVIPGSGWYRVKNNWYEQVCTNGRQYRDNAVAYVIRNINNINSLLVETKEMYDESLIPVQEERPIGITKAPVVILKHVPGERIPPQLVPREIVEEKVDSFESTEYVSEELAPGLFTHVRAIISGNVINCSACNIGMAIPMYKSVHDEQKVMFCSDKCIENYPFGSSRLGKGLDLELLYPTDDKSCTNYVFTIGEGVFGQLGLDIPYACKFKKINISQNSVKVACGGLHTLFLTKNGKVWSFGCNDGGPIGHDTTCEDENYVPDMVELPETIIDISAGDSFSLALSASGKLYFWGSFRVNTGQVGIIMYNPMQIMTGVSAIASGANHILALSRKNIVYSMGVGENGQLGREIRGIWTDTMGKISVNSRFDKIWTGEYSSFAREVQTGNIYAWGLNNYHQLGLPNHDETDVYISEPTISPTFNPNANWVAIACGQHHTLALTETGNVYAMGRPHFGRLGLGVINTEQDVEHLTRIDVLPKCVSISCNATVSYAVDSVGKVWSWGASSNQLCHKTDKWEPAVIPMNSKSKVLSVSAGGQHAAVIACV